MEFAVQTSQDVPLRDRVRSIFLRIEASSKGPLRFGGRAFVRPQHLRRNDAFVDGFEAIETLVSAAVTRERTACAEIASRYSADAAGEILARAGA